MKILIAVANGMGIISSMVGMSFLYKSWWRRVAPKRLVASAVIGGATLAGTVASSSGRWFSRRCAGAGVALLLRFPVSAVKS